MNLGEKIRDFRKERGITLTSLAAGLDISPSYLSSIERNMRRPSIQVLKRIGSRLNIPVNYLVGSEGDILTGKKLKYMRESRNLSLEELSEICDLPAGMLKKIEDGREIPDLDCLKKISLGLNIAIKYFLDNSSGNCLGKRLKKVRRSRGLTVPGLAVKAGVDPEVITGMEEGGDTPPLGVIEALAAALQTSPAFLLMESRDVEELLSTLGDGLSGALKDPVARETIKSLKHFDPAGIRHIINFIQFFKRSRPPAL